MVIGERFAWGHLQKTGGDATLAMFHLFPHLIEFADRADTNEKHRPFSSKADQIEGKLLAANFRQLPSWTLSWMQHRVHHSNKIGQSIPLESTERMAALPRADWRLAALTDHGRLQVDRWLKKERLVDEFLDFVSEFTDLTAQDRQRVTELGSVNALQYDHDPSHWFTNEQIDLMYRRNPLWSSVERKVYGGLFQERGWAED
jgi:hypothetical protein